MEKPEKISEKIIINNGFKKIVQKKFQTKKGNVSNFLTMGNSQSSTVVMILALDKKRNIIYVNEFRYGPEKYICNFPSGIKESHLSSLESAKLELEEESGYTSDDIRYLGKGIVGSQDRDCVKYFIALNSEFKGQKLGECEYIKVHTTTIGNFKKLVKEGYIKSPLTIHCFCLSLLQGFIDDG